MKEKISFVIPALNEESRIPRLLESLSHISGRHNIEIIVADGHSTDNTVAIAGKHGAKVVRDDPGAPRTIANGRNTGAGIATGNLLIFCDADTAISDPDYFLDRVQKVFEDPGITGGVPRLSVFPDERNAGDRLFHLIFNTFIRISFHTKSPFCGGQCQIVRRSAFLKEHGYDSAIVHGEDSDLFRRLHKNGKLHYFRELEVYESARRYRTDGYIPLIFKGALSIAYQRIFKRNFFSEWKRVEDLFGRKAAHPTFSLRR